jgi:3-hydroxyacyl-CoA dehydrogenase
VSDSIYDIDQAMKLGYNWKFGPFELIDQIGADNLKHALLQQKMIVPPILASLKRDQNFYQNNSYFTGTNYINISRPEGVIFLSDFKQLLASNSSGNIWDIGDKVAALEINTKMAVLDSAVFNMIIEFFTNKASDHKALIILGGSSNFSAGGNLQFMLDMALKEDWQAIEEYLELGAKAMLSIKYATIPVVCALKGMALGGGAELLLHSSMVIAHAEANSGLVEAGVGLIPGWGGCKELILRSKTEADLIKAFKNIIEGKISTCGYELQQMFGLDNFNISMNINRVVGDAKAACIDFKSSQHSRSVVIVNWDKIIAEMNLSGHDLVIAKKLVSLFENSNASEDELMKQEREIFIELLKSKATQERIAYMLEKGKRLRN